MEDNELFEYTEITREQVVQSIRSSISGLKLSATSEFIMKLIEEINDEVPYESIISKCESIRFEVL